MFIDKNKFLSEKKIMARVAKSIKMLANLPVLEKAPVKFQFPEVDNLRGTLISLNNVNFKYPATSQSTLLTS